MIGTVFQASHSTHHHSSSPNEVHNEKENTHVTTICSASRSKALGRPDENWGLEYPSTKTQVSWKAYSAGIGTLTFRSTKTKFTQQRQDFERSEEDDALHKSFAIALVLRFGSCRRGFNLRTNDTFDIWSLNSIRRVFDDSPVFQHCMNGDTQSVKQLVLRGMASPFDVDSSGRSLLHVSVNFYGLRLFLTDKLVRLRICTCRPMSISNM